MKRLRTGRGLLGAARRPQSSVLPRLLFLWALLTLSGAAWAHYVMEYELGGTVLCVDPSSVQVGVRGDGSTPNSVVEAALHRRLSRYLAEALSRYGVAHESRASCAGHPNFVLLHLLIFHAGTEGLGDDYSYTYTVSAQVGGHVSGPDLAVEETLPGSRYAAISSFIYSEEATGQSYQSYLPGLAEALVRDLVSAWWLDNPLEPPRPSPVLPLAGGALALLAALVTWWALGRRRRRVRTGLRSRA